MIEPTDVEASNALQRLAALNEALRAADVTLLHGDSRSALTSSQARLVFQLDRLWPSPEQADQASVLRIGCYTIEHELGRGGFGVVFLAHSEDHRQVALKVPRPEMLGQAAIRQRFLREAQAMVALIHPHIVRVWEVGQAGLVDYIASEYCPQGSLEQWLAKHADKRRLSCRQAAMLIQRLAGAVHYVHELGILHRDLKPSNVLLQTCGSDTTGEDDLPFVPMLTDFGLAKLVEQSVEETRSSMLLGTPLYMAPEQAACRHDEVCPATDVYSLGVILYEALVGRPPFVGPGLLAVLNEVRTKEPLPPRKLRGEVPPALERICLKCLAKEPAERYSTAAALEADLARFLAGKEVTARPPGALKQFQKWLRDPQRIVDAGVWGLVFNISMLIWITWNLPYILWAPNLNFDRQPVAMAATMLALVGCLPQVVAGFFTFRGKRWALWLGFGVGLSNWLYSLAGQAGLINHFGNLYDATPGLRVMMFGLISTLLLSVVLLYTAALFAAYSDRRPRGI